MTAQNAPSARARAPSELTARAAATLLASAAPPAVVDARAATSHALERVRGSLTSPPTAALHGRTVLFYDAGSTSLAQPFSLAAAAIARYAPAVSPDTHLALVRGGLPALRAAAPHLIHFDPASAHALRRRVKGMPWALRLLDQVADEAAPPGCVLPWLYVGAAAHAYDAQALTAGGFTHIVVVGGELKARFRDRFCYLHIRARDTANFPLKDHFPQVVGFLDALSGLHARGQNVKCLVHCFAGASRSVAVVVAYLVWKGMSAEHALAAVKERRKAADPNEGFLKQVAEWEDEVCRGMHRDLPAPLEEQLHLPVPSNTEGEQFYVSDREEKREGEEDGRNRRLSPHDSCDAHKMAFFAMQDRRQPPEGCQLPTTPLPIPSDPGHLDVRYDLYDPGMLPSPTTPQAPEGLRPQIGTKNLSAGRDGLKETPPSSFSLTRAFLETDLGTPILSTQKNTLTSSRRVAQHLWASDLSDLEQSDMERYIDVSREDSTLSDDC